MTKLSIEEARLAQEFWANCILGILTGRVGISTEPPDQSLVAAVNPLIRQERFRVFAVALADELTVAFKERLKDGSFTKV